MQNLVGAGAIVSIIYASFSVLRVWLEKAYSRLFWVPLVI